VLQALGMVWVFERTLEDWMRRGTESASGGFRACTTRKMSQRRLSYYTEGSMSGSSLFGETSNCTRYLTRGGRPAHATLL
jgi:hypothetical protein